MHSPEQAAPPVAVTELTLEKLQIQLTAARATGDEKAGEQIASLVEQIHLAAEENVHLTFYVDANGEISWKARRKEIGFHTLPRK